MARIYQEHETDVFDSFRRTGSSVEVTYVWVAHQRVTYEFRIVSGEGWIGWIKHKLGLSRRRYTIELRQINVKSPERETTYMPVLNKQAIEDMWNKALYDEITEEYNVRSDIVPYDEIAKW